MRSLATLLSLSFLLLTGLADAADPAIELRYSLIDRENSPTGKEISFRISALKISEMRMDGLVSPDPSVWRSIALDVLFLDDIAQYGLIDAFSTRWAPGNRSWIR